MKTDAKSKEEFMHEFGITDSQLVQCDLKWPVIKAIADDHEKQKHHLQNSAREIANTLNLCPDVHTVSWRVKDTKGLVKKILRKRTEISNIEAELIGVKAAQDGESELYKYLQAKLTKLEKWRDISVDNYFKVITDLVGVRALHIFLDGCVPINNFIRDNWDLTKGEKVIIYTLGDKSEFADHIADSEVEPHRKGYRSIHYIIESKPRRRVLKSEIQVRTIFQEGWGEIDHMINYPESSGETDVQNFLMLFSTLAGNADAMGSFVQQLSKTFASARNDNETLKEQHKKELEQQNIILESVTAKLKTLENKAASKDIAKDILGDITNLETSIRKNRPEALGTDRSRTDLLKGLTGLGMAKGYIDLLVPSAREVAMGQYLDKLRRNSETMEKAMKSALGVNYKDIPGIVDDK